MFFAGLFQSSASQLLMAGGLCLTSLTTQAQSAPPVSQTAAQPSSIGIPFTANQLQQLLPPSVYFQGKTATLQIRNGGGTTFPGKDIVWAALVDTSGYATDVKERYQLHMVTEGPLRIGDREVPAGAYGAGFVGDQFVLLDIGGHQIATVPTREDAAMRHPRPLQVLPESPNAVKLYVGRKWVEVVYAGHATEH